MLHRVGNGTLSKGDTMTDGAWIMNCAAIGLCVGAVLALFQLI